MSPTFRALVTLLAFACASTGVAVAADARPTAAPPTPRTAPATASPAAATPRPGAASPIEVRGAYSHPTPPGAAVGAAFMEIRSTVADRLVEVRSPVARRAEVHSTSMDGGVMRMRRAGPIAVGPAAPVLLEPGGLHLMLYGLDKPLVAGQRVPLELRFEKSGVVRAEAVVHGDDGAGHP
jgi:copper(I)-binding protein